MPTGEPADLQLAERQLRHDLRGGDSDSFLLKYAIAPRPTRIAKSATARGLAGEASSPAARCRVGVRRAWRSGHLGPGGIGMVISRRPDSSGTG